LTEDRGIGINPLPVPPTCGLIPTARLCDRLRDTFAGARGGECAGRCEVGIGGDDDGDDVSENVGKGDVDL
jgi:hypothetical protein